MLCCWKKTTEIKTLSKPLLAESKSVTGEPKIFTERRPTGFEPSILKSVPVPIKSEPIPAKMISVYPPKLDSAYSYPAPVPAPIYIKSELSLVKPESPMEIKPETVEVKTILVTAPLQVKPEPVEVKPEPVEVKPEPVLDPVEVKPESAPAPADIKLIKKKNFKSNKRI